RTYWPLILIFIGLGKMWDAARRRQNPDAPCGYSWGLTLGMLAFVLVLIVLLLHGRAFSRDHRFASTLHHETRTVERQGALSARASLQVGAGQLTIGGGSSHLL